MKRFSLYPGLLSAVIALVLAFGIGGVSSAPASCQEDDGPDVEECEVKRVTREGDKICLHGLKCPDIEAKKLCFKVPLE